MNFGERLKAVRQKRNLTLLEIAERLGKTEATIQRYESGNIKNLKSDVIEEISNILKVSPAYLMGWVPEDNSLYNSKYTYFPSSVAAGVPSNVEGITDSSVQTIIIPDAIMGKWAGSSDIAIMRINGESMNKVIPNGSLIGVRKCDFYQLKDDDIVLFSDEHDYSIKRFFNDKENERFIFRPDSKDARFIDYTISYENAQNLTLYGKVVVYIVTTD